MLKMFLIFRFEVIAMEENWVVVRKAADDVTMRKNYVTLPADYGTDAYFRRKDVQEIRRLVFETLDCLQAHQPFLEKLKNSNKAVIKPNLVSVYYKSGMKDLQYPESTDPRVLDAVVEWVQQYQPRVVIAESSGKPMPTKTSFKTSGIDRIAKYRKTQLVTLETQPVTRYLLPKAKVMKEVLLPSPFDEVAQGSAFYISVPKLKTNLYTRVTLGFKNSMGIIPYALRERNHNYHIDDKLTDLLYIIRPNVTLIDGIVGGEGNTPAPVDPVDSRVVIAGVDPVATDRIGTKIMGFDLDSIPLLVKAAERGFDHGNVQIDGEIPQYHFRPADASLLGDTFHKHFPNVMVLVGHDLPHTPKVADPHAVTPQMAREIEASCRGGCLAALRSGFEYVVYAPKKDMNKALAVVVGAGVECNGQRWWFDREGTPYTEQDIRKMQLPLLALGNCASGFYDAAKWKAPGCCSPSACMLAATAAMEIPFPLLSLKNKWFFNFGANAVGMVLTRCVMSLAGVWIDCPSEHVDKVYPVPAVSAVQAKQDFIPWPLPKMDWKMRLKMAKDQISILKL